MWIDRVPTHLTLLMLSVEVVSVQHLPCRLRNCRRKPRRFRLGDFARVSRRQDTCSKASGASAVKPQWRKEDRPSVPFACAASPGPDFWQCFFSGMHILTRKLGQRFHAGKGACPTVSFGSQMFRSPAGRPPWRHGLHSSGRDQPRGVPPSEPRPARAALTSDPAGLKRRRLDAHWELHAAVGRAPPAGRSFAGPTPTQEIQLLAELTASGACVEQLLEDITLARARAALATSTNSSYASHRRMISWACSVLGEMPIPASLDLILRVSALVNNHNTLGVWLAAWRDWHIQEREQWPGDQNPFLRRVRKGTERLNMLEPTPRSQGQSALSTAAQAVAASSSEEPHRLRDALQFGIHFRSPGSLRTAQPV